MKSISVILALICITALLDITVGDDEQGATAVQEGEKQRNDGFDIMLNTTMDMISVMMDMIEGTIMRVQKAAYDLPDGADILLDRIPNLSNEDPCFKELFEEKYDLGPGSENVFLLITDENYFCFQKYLKRLRQEQFYQKRHLN